jgi:hypothetical protein
MRGLLEIGSRDHELHATHVKRSLYDLLEIVFVASLAVIDAAKDWITEVDAHLPTVSAAPPREARMLTHISVPKSPFFRHIAAC